MTSSFWCRAPRGCAICPNGVPFAKVCPPSADLQRPNPGGWFVLIPLIICTRPRGFSPNASGKAGSRRLGPVHRDRLSVSWHDVRQSRHRCPDDIWYPGSSCRCRDNPLVLMAACGPVVRCRIDRRPMLSAAVKSIQVTIGHRCRPARCWTPCPPGSRPCVDPRRSHRSTTHNRRGGHRRSKPYPRVLVAVDERQFLDSEAAATRAEAGRPSTRIPMPPASGTGLRSTR